MQESDGVTYSKQENDQQKNYLKYFSKFFFPICKMLNKIMASGRHSLVLEVEMDDFSVLCLV